MHHSLIIFFSILTISGALSAQTWTQQTSGIFTNLNSAYAASNEVCWMCGPGGVVRRTTNGGATWTNAGGGELTGRDFYCIFAFDAISAWIGSGDGRLYRTTNGGAGWKFIPLTPTNPFIDVIQFWDA